MLETFGPVIGTYLGVKKEDDTVLCGQGSHIDILVGLVPKPVNKAADCQAVSRTLT
jgi:hypothetical protein